MPLTKFRKDSKELKPWVIYLWEEGDLIKGAAKVITNDGLDEIFISGRTIERDEEWQKPNKKKDKYIAKSQTKTDLQNTLNALNWYGIRILNKGGIDDEKFIKEELKAGVTASGIHIDISKMYPIQKFPIKNITFDKAQELGLT
jgi:hypothetical protein